VIDDILQGCMVENYLEAQMSMVSIPIVNLSLDPFVVVSRAF
jgi:hypothetical protein